uniref:Uncharacterized protein n=1 Tax=Kalanchoe fedtschenkoi TaxID=63787 RepID=A0A7N0TQH0_KALFE
MNNLGDDSLMEPLKEDCSSVSRVDINAGGEQSICHNEPVAPETVHEKSTDRVLLQTAEPPEDNSNRKKVMSVTNVTSRNGKEKSIHAEEAVGQGSNLERSPRIVQRKISNLSQDCSRGNIIASNTFAAVKEYSDGVTDCHGSSVASADKIVHREVNTQRSPLTKNREANAREERIGISTRADLVSHKKVAKGEYAFPRSQGAITTLKQISLQINSSKSMEESSKNESQKGDNSKLTYNMDCTQSLRHISTAKDKLFPLKTIKRSVDLTGLKSSRSIEGKTIQSISATVKEIKSLKGLKHKIHENITSKATCPDFTEKQKPGTPTLKRKQAPTGGKLPETPLKRLSQSPKSSSKNVPHIKIQEQVQHQNNTSSKNTGIHSVDMSRTLTFDTPQEMNLSVFELQPEMGNYGNVEKAEAYGKDLDDLWNMLKKIHEEAKELLVRAVINNTNLLLLNHPMHDEKISFLI